MEISSYATLIDDVATKLELGDSINLASRLGFLEKDLEEIRTSDLPGLSLIEKLEDGGIIDENNLDILVGVLEEFKLSDIAEMVKEYKPSQDEPSLSKKATNIPLEEGKQCTDHSSLCELLCNDCNKLVCFVCITEGHSSHTVIHYDDFYKRGPEEIKRLSQVFDVIERKWQGVMEIQRDQEIKCQSSCLDSELDRRYLLARTRIENQREKLFQENEALKNKIMSLWNSKSEKISLMIEKLETIEKEALPFLGKHSLGPWALRNLQKQEHMLRSLNQEILMTQIEISKENVAVRALHLSNDGQFAKLNFSKIIGGYKMSDTQYVVLTDDRIQTGNIVAQCINTKMGGAAQFNHTIKCPDFKSTLAFSNRELQVYGVEYCILAVSQTIYKIRLEDAPGDGYKGFSTCDLIHIPLEDQSTITSLHTNDNGCAFAVSYPVPMIYYSNASFDILQKIECSFHVTSISDIACDDDGKFLICDPSNDYVHLVGKDVTTEYSSFVFRRVFPTGETDNPRPVSLLFDGSQYIILWVSEINEEPEEFKWEVTIHDNSGAMLRKCKSGNCSKNKYPHSVSRIRQTLAIGFIDGSFEEFKSTNNE